MPEAACWLLLHLLHLHVELFLLRLFRLFLLQCALHIGAVLTALDLVRSGGGGGLPGGVVHFLGEFFFSGLGLHFVLRLHLCGEHVLLGLHVGVGFGRGVVLRVAALDLVRSGGGGSLPCGVVHFLGEFFFGGLGLHLVLRLHFCGEHLVLCLLVGGCFGAGVLGFPAVQHAGGSRDLLLLGGDGERLVLAGEEGEGGGEVGEEEEEGGEEGWVGVHGGLWCWLNGI